MLSEVATENILGSINSATMTPNSFKTFPQTAGVSYQANHPHPVSGEVLSPENNKAVQSFFANNVRINMKGKAAQLVEGINMNNLTADNRRPEKQVNLDIQSAAL